MKIDEVIQYLEANSGKAFDHPTHGGDWFQDFRLEVRETRNEVRQFNRVAEQLLQRLADGEIVIRPRQDPTG